MKVYIHLSGYGILNAEIDTKGKDLTDFLNSTEQFFTAHREYTKPVTVNKEHIINIYED